MGYLGNQITTVFPTSISVDSATISGNTTVGGTLGVTGVSTLSDNIVFDASSKGVHLGVTSATASNLLDDYEKGTFTADLEASGATITQSISRGDYTKIGNTVYFNIYVQIDGTLSGNGNDTKIQGLPFTSVNNSQRVYFNYASVRYVNLDNGYNALVGYINNNDTNVQLYQIGDNVVLKALASSSLSNVSGQIFVQGFYHID